MPVPTFSESDGQGQLHLDELAVNGTQGEKVAGITDSPTGLLETFLLFGFHRDFSLTIFQYAASRP